MSSSSGEGTAYNAEVNTGQHDTRSPVEIARAESATAGEVVERLTRKRDKAKAHLADAEQALKDAKSAQKTAAQRLKEAEAKDGE